MAPSSVSSSSSSYSTSTALSTPPDLEMATEGRETPIITLDADEISHEMAARLTIALLGQMLYMKGQVPFPVASLGRMTERRAAENTSRAAKKRIEFLESYDDLTSHLRTTFVALSTAFAQNETQHPLLPTSSPTSTPSTTGSRQRSPSKVSAKTRPSRRPAKVHVLLLLGPSPSSAKARVLLELDGLRVERFGEWEFKFDNHDNEDKESESESDDQPSVQPVKALSPTTPLRTDRYEHDAPYTSSSGSFYTMSGSVPSSPSPSSSSDASFSDDGDELSESQAQRLEEVSHLAFAQHVEDASLRAGERLLSRALFAGGEGLGFGEEISPTQAHILIRAPRRFTHSTWVPRQSLGCMLDKHVQAFLQSESCRGDGKARAGVGRTRPKGVFGVGLRTVGVRVRCRGECAENGVGGNVANRGGDRVHDIHADDSDDCSEEDEENELIWWSWDGKLVGFSD